MNKIFVWMIAILCLCSFASAHTINFYDLFSGTQGNNSLYYVNGTINSPVGLQNMTWNGNFWFAPGTAVGVFGNYTRIGGKVAPARISIGDGDGHTDYGQPFLRYIIPSNMSGANINVSLV